MFKRRFLNVTNIDLYMKLFVIQKKSEKVSQSGFTIIETLVAITILMVAIVGPLTVAFKGLSAAVYARDQMIGSYLAQDAMEFIKNMRDNNKLSSTPRSWLYGLDLCLAGSGGTCRVDTQTLDGDIRSCNITNESCARLWLDDTKGYNHQSLGAKSQFSRVVSIIPSVNGNPEAKVKVTVAWQNGTVNNSVTLENQFFDIPR